MSKICYKQIKHVRRTPVELKAFKYAKLAFMEQGYPEEVAEAYAWDCLWAARIGKREGLTV